ncbi:ribosome-inactivating protein bryodin II-like [Pyrus x bretschneideri]|uniref:ribosome-inactivating protein bryodin II-like n=1 Tax=Pyrus x bretschneideri TaxID=225117 RepID=UPI00202EA949|nr:ribosome-inactivating protein bryodin II-like [Pyrus x bretschneideri]
MALSFSIKNATTTTYRTFIEALRAQLTAGGSTSHGIPVLRRRQDVTDDQRFVLVNLTNYDSYTITVAIDVVNAYVVGYCAGTRSYFLRDPATHPPPLHRLFPGTTRTTLPFAGDYLGLGRAAQEALQQNTNRNRAAGSRIHENIPMRERIPLGPGELDNAISQLRYAESASSQAAAFIVIIQIVSEAARFRYIQGQVRDRIRDGTSAVPDPAMLSLENSWSNLSEQIQMVPANQLLFINNGCVQIRKADNSIVLVKSVDSDAVRSVAFLLYCGGNPPAPNSESARTSKVTVQKPTLAKKKK